MKTSSYVSVFEALHLSGLEPRALLEILASGSVPFSHGTRGELMVDVAALTPELIARRGLQTGPIDPHPDSVLIEELVASAVVDAMGEIVEESLALAERWLSEDGYPTRSEGREPDA